MIDTLIAALEEDFPQDRTVKVTGSREYWFKIDKVNKILYVPPEAVLNYSEILIDKFIERLHSFARWEDWKPEYDWTNINRTVITTPKQVFELMKYPLLACDIETAHLGLENNKLLALSIAYSENDVVCIANWTPEMIWAVRKLLSSETIQFLWHNGKFDTTRLRATASISSRVDEDSMLLHYVGVNERKGTHKLKDLAPLYLQAPEWDDELDAFKKKWCREHKIKLEDFTYDLIPVEILLPYSMLDAVATFRLLKLFKEIARPECFPIYRKLIQASNTFGRIEMNGIAVDIPHLASLADEFCTELVGVESRCNDAILHLWDAKQYKIDSGAKTLPKDFNLKSPKQLKWIIEKAVGHRIESTDEATLDKLFLEESDNNTFLTALKELRKLSKKIDTYVTGIDSVIQQDGRVRCTYNLHGTETGRLSCNEPNMQNIPRDKHIKNIFKAAEGYKFVQLDYSQAELRVLAYLSNDPIMKDIYKNDKDIHAYTATKLFGPDFTKEDRNKAKPVNFGIVYGITGVALSEDLKISKQEANKFIDGWHRAFPVATKYINTVRENPFRGIECNTPFGRNRHFIITNENRYHVRNEAINTPIQSIASDLTLISLLTIQEYIDSHHLNARIVATVHDSILLEVFDNEALIREIATQAQWIMADVPTHYLSGLDIPFKADVETGYSWGKLEEYK